MLYVVHKGGVKLALTSQVGKRMTLDMRSEGEMFGLLSVMGREPARLDVTAIEDTLCYSIPAEEVQRLISTQPEFANYLIRTSLSRYMDRSLQALRTQAGLMGDSERLLYSLAAGDVVSSPPLLCQKETTIREAAQMLASTNATCVFVVGRDGAAEGILTDQDFAAKVVSEALSLELPVTRIMSQPVITVEGNERVFHALLAMVSRNIHHVLVTQQGVPAGVLTAHDLMVLQGKSRLNVVRHIEEQGSVTDLAAAQSRIAGLLPLLLREGAKASHISRVVAEVNDRLTVKVLRLAEKKLGPPPVPYCWVVLGSEGRREQTFKTDQDNALIYADAEDQDGRFIRRWGGFGATAGQFNAPGGIAVSPINGNVYVADTNNHRVQVFTSDGAFLLQFGGAGSGNSQFNQPQGVAASGLGIIYVADTGNHRIQLFDATGVFLGVLGGNGTAEGLFVTPNKVAVDANGNVYVADTGNHRLQVYGPGGDLLGLWGGRGNGDGQFQSPAGIAVDFRNRVYVVDGGNRVQRLSFEPSLGVAGDHGRLGVWEEGRKKEGS